ncbi:MAG: sigma-70 family RNA polymerase sigma factor [Acidimicrobiia bacterium]
MSREPDRAPPRPRVQATRVKPVHADEKRRSETLIVIRCQLGERDAFRDLVDTWQRPLSGFVTRMCDDPATVDDIVQSIWLKVVRGLPRLRDPAGFPAWIFSIARRCVIDRYRRHDPVEPLDETVDEAFDDLDDRLAAGEIAGAVAGLPPAEREVVELHYLVDLSIADIAQVVGAPEGTVKSRLSRARRMLAPALTHLRGIEADDESPEE